MSATRIGRYEIVRPLGKGAMGVVYLARDPGIDRDVALKTVRFDGPGSSFKQDEAKARFLKEARISGRLQHPHIVTVYDVGEDEGTLYLAMEYVPGGNLAQRIAEHSQNPLPLEDRIRIVAEVAQALGHAHERGVIHRDVKPANILLSPALSAKVSDFGIGKLVSGDTDLTSTGQMVGSPSYMSPEQMRGEKLDVRSDIFSLGVVLYQTLTGKKPFPADTLTTLVYQILHEEPAPIFEAARGQELSPELWVIVRKCLAKKREDRYGDASEVSAELGALIGLSPVQATTALSESRVRKAGGLSGTGTGSGSRPLPPPPTVISDTDTPTITVRTGESTIPAPPLPPTAVIPRTEGAEPGSAKRTMAMAGVGVAVVALLGWAFLGGRRDGDRPADNPVTVPRATPPQAVTPTPSPVVVAATDTTPTPEVSPAPTPEANGTPAAETTPGAPEVTPTKKPAAKPTKTPVPPTPTPTPVPTLIPADVTYSVRKVVRLSIAPDQARVFLNGKFIGIADDWDDSGGGSLLTFATDGRHRLRCAYPGHKDLLVDILVVSNAAEEKVTVKQEMKTGKAEGWPGPSGDIGKPGYRTVGPVLFETEPSDAIVTVNGKNLGRANMWSPQAPLLLPEQAVYDVVLSKEGYESKAVRVLMSKAAGKPEAVVKEKLKAR